MKAVLKATLRGIFLVVAFPLALLSAFGRVVEMYRFWAQACALIPGLPGDYLRTAYYRMTLEKCAAESRIQFGSYFSYPQVRIGHNVYIGSYCVLGHTTIGERTQIASGVQILSGGRQHERTPDGRLEGSDIVRFERIEIGADCWLGAGAIIMAPIAEGSTIGAGSVVTHPIPARSIAVGSPARVIKSSVGAAI